jgi:hypothetical protein
MVARVSRSLSGLGSPASALVRIAAADFLGALLQWGCVPGNSNFGQKRLFSCPISGLSGRAGAPILIPISPEEGPGKSQSSPSGPKGAARLHIAHIAAERRLPVARPFKAG